MKTVSEGNERKKLVAAFPLSNTELALVFPEPLHPSFELETRLFQMKSGLPVRDVNHDKARPDQLILRVKPMISMPLTIDQVMVSNIKDAKGESLGGFVSPPFIQGIHNAMELKVPHFKTGFPYTTTLAGLHVSLSCCTGCNGGIHNRNLVVLNLHSPGGPWSGIWVRTDKTIEAPYPRWQRLLVAGGVIAEEGGSMIIVDQGWMVVRKVDDPVHPHRAPPPLLIKTDDLPAVQMTSLLCKSLDGVWVQFDDITIQSVRNMPAPKGYPEKSSLPGTEIVFQDNSGGRSIAWLYQTSAHDITIGQRIKMLRGFVHAEKPGRYILLSDKEEDLII